MLYNKCVFPILKEDIHICVIICIKFTPYKQTDRSTSLVALITKLFIYYTIYFFEIENLVRTKLAEFPKIR